MAADGLPPDPRVPLSDGPDLKIQLKIFELPQYLPKLTRDDPRRTASGRPS